jgi:hypothetical protein
MAAGLVVVAELVDYCIMPMQHAVEKLPMVLQ